MDRDLIYLKFGVIMMKTNEELRVKRDRAGKTCGIQGVKEGLSVGKIF